MGQTTPKPEVILFQGTTHDKYWYNRAIGPYKLATYLKENISCQVQVIPNCTALTRAGFEQVFRKYGSSNLRWIGFTTNWLAGRQTPKYYFDWWHQPETIMDTLYSGEWFHIDVDDRERVYSCVYDQEMFYEIIDLARIYNPECQLVFGGSQLNRNEYFHPDVLMPEAHYIQGNAELAVAQMHRRFRKGNFNTQNLPSNDEYDFHNFKTSFAKFEIHDHITPDEWLPIEISRGCAFKCKFCNYDMKDTRKNYVDPTVLKENIIKLHERWGTTKFTIMDDLYNDDYDKVQDLYDNCWSQLPFKPELAGYLRLDLLWKRPDQARLLLDSGFKAGSFGIETLHDKAGKAVGKGLGKQRILETLRMLLNEWKNRILIHAFFIAGLPHEDEHSMMATVEWTKETHLIHAVIWHWLELENIKILPDDTNVTKLSVLDEDPEKYGYTFQPDPMLMTKGSAVRQQATKSKVKKIKIMNQLDDLEKKWLSDHLTEQTYSTNWTNNVGVGLDYCKLINRLGNQVKLNTYFTLYADKRATGLTHDQIMHQSIANDGDSHLYWENEVKKPKTIERLRKIIT